MQFQFCRKTIVKEEKDKAAKDVLADGDKEWWGIFPLLFFPSPKIPWSAYVNLREMMKSKPAETVNKLMLILRHIFEKPHAQAILEC